MKRLPTLPALAVCAALMLVGCAPSTAVDQSGNADAPADQAPSQPTPGVAAPERGTDTALEPIDAYALCKAQTLAIIAPAELSGISWAPFDSATWLIRDDDAIGIYIEASNENQAAGSAGREVALTCKVGGTVGEPDWVGFGVSSRQADRDAILEALTSTDQA